MKKSICTLIFILGVCRTFAYYWTDPETGINWQYCTCEGGVSVGGGDCKQAVSKSMTGHLAIPAKINNLSVRQIGIGAFYQCADLTSISIPEGVTLIGGSAFSQCENLTEISIPEGVTQIGDGAFYQCHRIETLATPTTLISLGEVACYECTNLSEVVLNDGLTEIGHNAFGQCYRLEELRIPQSVILIKPTKWASAAGLVTDCISLHALSIPFVGKCRENYDTSGEANAILGKLFMHDTSPRQEKDGFLNVMQYYSGKGVNYICASIPTNLTDVSVTDDKLLGIAAFQNCKMIERIQFGDTLERIRSIAFMGCTGLKEIRFGKNVKTIEKEAFAECEAFDIIFTGDNPTDVDSSIFGGEQATYSSSNGMIYVEYGTKGWNGDYTSLDLPTDGLWPSSGVVRRRIAYNPETYHPPVFSQAEGVYDGISTDIEISCDDPDAAIYYTLDGSEPSQINGKLYSKPITIYETKTIRAVSIKSGWLANPMATATYTKANEIGPAINLLEMLPDNDKTHPWTVVSDVTHDGVSAVKSGEISDDESTTMKVVVYGAGELSFWWRTSCEPTIGGEWYDFATFYDGTTAVTNLAGVTDWQRVVRSVDGTGKHTFKWTYQKDGSGSTVPDGVWVDQVQWLPKTDDWYSDHTLTTEAPVKYDWLRKYGLAIEDDFETAAKAVTGKSDGSGRELTVEDDFVAGTDPTNELSHIEATIEMTDGVPIVRWTPDLNEDGSKELRTYKIWGKETLDNSSDWEYPTNSLHHFFRVTVEMP